MMRWFTLGPAHQVLELPPLDFRGRAVELHVHESRERVVWRWLDDQGRVLGEVTPARC